MTESPLLPGAMTFSLVAFDRGSGRLGAAVASHSAAVGGSVVYSRLGVGLVNTQHHAHLFLGDRVLDGMEEGLQPQQALDEVLREDPDSAGRQLIAFDVQRRMGVWTGERCREHKGHRIADCLAIAGNTLATPGVLDAMQEAYESSVALDFELRLLASIEEGERQGGDRRGTRSVAIKIVPPPESRTPVNLDLRVDDHDAPIVELRRLHRVFREEFPR